MAEINQPSAWAKEAWEWGKKEGITDGTRPKDAPTRRVITPRITTTRRWPGKDEVLQDYCCSGNIA